MAIKILVVDDEHAIAYTVAEILRTAGYEVATAYNGTQALAQASQCCPSLLLTDVLMPQTNGFEVALEIKRKCPECRLLLFSGQASTAQLASTYVQTFTNRGYRFELLPKPLHPDSLLKRLQESLMRRS